MSSAALVVARQPHAVAERDEFIAVPRHHDAVAAAGFQLGRKFAGEFVDDGLLDGAAGPDRAAVDAAMAGVEHDHRRAGGGDRRHAGAVAAAAASAAGSSPAPPGGRRLRSQRDSSICSRAGSRLAGDRLGRDLVTRAGPARSMTMRDLPGPNSPKRKDLTICPSDAPLRSAPDRRIDLEIDLGHVDDDPVRVDHRKGARFDRRAKDRTSASPDRPRRRGAHRPPPAGSKLRPPQRRQASKPERQAQAAIAARRKKPGEPQVDAKPGGRPNSGGAHRHPFRRPCQAFPTLVFSKDLSRRHAPESHA